MDVNSEFKNSLKSFKEGGAITKLFLFLGFFFSVSSLTSISSTIIQWKGFILEAIKFYQSHFVEPIASAGRTLGFSYSENEIHAGILLSISVSVGMRMLCESQIIAYREINKRYGSSIKPNLIPYKLISVAFPVLAWVVYGVFDPVLHFWLIVIVFLTYPLCLIIPKFVMSKFGYEQFEKGKINYLKKYYGYIFLLFLLVGVLAAVNAGLNEKTNILKKPPAEPSSN